MTQSVLERTGDQIAETARKTSRATSAVADAFEDGVEAPRRVAKRSGDAAEESWTIRPSACSGTRLKQLSRHSRRASLRE